MGQLTINVQKWAVLIPTLSLGVQIKCVQEVVPTLKILDHLQKVELGGNSPPLSVSDLVSLEVCVISVIQSPDKGD